MRIRILHGLPARLEGFDLGRFEEGTVHEINAPLCDLLVAYGYARPEPDEPVSGSLASRHSGAIRAFAEAAVMPPPPQTPGELLSEIKPDIEVRPGAGAIE